MNPMENYGVPVTPFHISNGALNIDFEINPSTYNPYPEKQYTLFASISGAPTTYSQPYDNTARTMTFERITSGFYNNLRTFATPNSYGQLTACTFTDGDVRAHVNANILVTKVHGEPITGLSGVLPTIDYGNVVLEFLENL